MSSIPSYGQSIQGHQPDLTKQLSNRIKKLEQENRELKQQILWEDKLFANPSLSPSHKLALRAAVYTIRKANQTPAGLTKIYIPLLAEKTGLSPKTVGKNLQYLADSGALVREAETDADANGQRITRIFIGLTEQIKTPEQITPPAPRNHGGLRHFCRDCGSENLIEQKTILCLDCGSEQSKITRLINDTDGQLDRRITSEETTSPTDNLAPFIKTKEPTDNLAAGYEKPATPPAARAAIITGGMEQGQERRAANISHEMRAAPEVEHDLHEAAMLLLDIAGDTPEYIAMNTNPEISKKYITVHNKLTLADMRKHLEGRRTLGATLRYQDGTTRALCFDADDPHTWQDIQASAGVLIAAGYKPLLAPSPNRGGHLWLIFSEHVNADAARHQVVTIAPALETIGEYWPNKGNQKVRLPAGKYVTPTFSQWTHLEGVQTDAEAPAIHRTLLANLTPAALIPDAAPAQVQEQADPAQLEQRPQRVATQTPDEQHQQKYGKHLMWVEWPSEQYLIDRFNAQHTIDDLAAYERSGMINAGQIGRPERTASVGVTPDGQRFTDFGAEARQPDGTQDGGDAFEFYIRSRGLDKSAALRELGRDLNRQASHELLRAARAGEPPPVWIMDILTDTGREVYNQNAQRHGHPPLEETRGVVGFSTVEQELQVGAEAVGMDVGRLVLSGPGELWQSEQKTTEPSYSQDYEGTYPPPQRPCYHCNVMAWQWNGETYICSNPGHPPE